MNDKQLQSFIVVAKLGSFSKAADELFLSKQALKKQIDSLERELCFTLFVRSAQGMTLTSAGKEYYTGAVEVLDMLKDINERCKSACSEDTLYIAASQDSADTFIAGTIPVFLMKFPEYMISHVEAESTQWLSAVSEGKLSLCLYADSPELTKLGLSYSLIRREAIYCFMDRKNPLSDKQLLTLEDLAGKNVYIGNRNWYTDISDYFEISGSGISLEEIRSSYSNIIQVCAAGGICLFSEWRIKHFEQLAAIRLDAETGFSFGIAHRQNPSQAVLRFIDTARDQYAK